jgi:rhamnose utilization protein RhaD (predicted bifunctional aldolase and dehydrogenase)
VIDELVALSRALGAPEHDYAILAEGNTSAALDERRLLVKASGTSLRDATAAAFLEADTDALLALLDQPLAGEAEQNEALAACAVHPGDLRPSVEAPLHAVAIRHGGARVVAHTHPTAVNALLCSAHAEDVVRPLFPDQVVVCGAAPLLLSYVDPGLPLARALREALLARAGNPPKTVYLRNHGLVVLAESTQEALQITAMAVKAARILGGALTAGGPVFLSDEEAAAIDRRLDEQFRRAMLARDRA